MEEFKKIVALSFIEAYRNNSLATTKNALAKFISEEINKKENGSVIDEHRYARTLLNYYNYYFNGGKQHTPSDTLINKLLKYLGYDSQKQFTNNQPSDLSYLEEVPFVDDKTEEPPEGPPEEEGEEEDEETRGGDGWKKIVITVSFIPLITAIIYWGIDWKQNGCMTWSEDRYVVIECGKTNSPDIALNRNLLENFRKIELDSTMKLFENGIGIYWYSRYDGKIEYFTKGGKHPTNGKTLKRISQPIVRKYIYGEE